MADQSAAFSGLSYFFPKGAVSAMIFDGVDVFLQSWLSVCSDFSSVTMACIDVLGAVDSLSHAVVYPVVLVPVLTTIFQHDTEFRADSKSSPFDPISQILNCQ